MTSRRPESAWSRVRISRTQSASGRRQVRRRPAKMPAMPVIVPRNRPGSSREVVCPVAPRASQTRAQDQSPMPPVKSSSALSGAQGG
ncbi:hypothetical protein [Salipiger sp. HF18]|uniref:hypothetical protein n=1 Tax=Salipiger sp. HF18 TaxID=2721557 RepID=UPI00142E164A|nr:hypothetical protein [Salipiger sp. HF18]